MNALRVTMQSVPIRLYASVGVERIRRFVSDGRGVTAIEYGLIAALIAVVIVVAVTAVGTSLNAIFTTVASDL